MAIQLFLFRSAVLAWWLQGLVGGPLLSYPYVLEELLSLSLSLLNEQYNMSIYPLVNCPITMERSTIFNSYVTNYQRVCQ